MGGAMNVDHPHGLGKLLRRTTSLHYQAMVL
jgi:hypothetical protein